MLHVRGRVHWRADDGRALAQAVIAAAADAVLPVGVGLGVGPLNGAGHLALEAGQAPEGAVRRVRRGRGRRGRGCGVVGRGHRCDGGDGGNGSEGVVGFAVRRRGRGIGC